MKKEAGLFVILIVSFFFHFSLAAAVIEGNCVEAIVSDVSPSSVSLDEEFTVGIIIDNCGTQISENVTFEITKISPEISVKEPLFQNIGKMGYANSNRFIKYHLRTSNSASPGNYEILYKLVYGSGQSMTEKSGSFSVTVIADEAKFNIASIKTKPVLVYAGDIAEVTLRIENYGKGDANSVKLAIDHPFSGAKESFMGTIKSKEDSPAIFTFITDQPGDFRFPLKISYHDDLGEHEVFEDISIVVLQKKEDNTATFYIAGAVLVILALMFYNYLTRRNKDKIIHQLLREKNIKAK